MRSQFIILLALTLFFSGWFFYKNAGPCVVPQAYSVGSIDQRFKITTSTAETIIAEAVQVWEDAANRELFIYDAGAPFKIEFIYDDRQEKSDNAESQKEVLSEKEAESKKINERYINLVTDYDALKIDYDSTVSRYQKRLEDFNATVAAYNAAGGAPADKFETLQKTEASLKTEKEKLETTASSLATIAKNINALSEQGNAVIADYNQTVNRYNEKFTSGEEFTQGDYTGDSIHVYHFKDQTELKNVLIHEFGHAIGLPHVEGDDSIMYYLMDKQPTTSELSAEDMVALGGSCKMGDSFSSRFHKFFSSLFITINLI